MLDILLMVVSVILILLSLLQSGKSDGISGAFYRERRIKSVCQCKRERTGEDYFECHTGCRNFVLRAGHCD